MKILPRLIGDTLLIGILMSLLFLPFGAVGLSKVQQNNAVLSETTQYEPATDPQVNMKRQVEQNDRTYPFEDPGYFDRVLQSSETTQPTTEPLIN